MSSLAASFIALTSIRLGWRERTGGVAVAVSSTNYQSGSAAPKTFADPSIFVIGISSKAYRIPPYTQRTRVWLTH